jgi:hypothetical protein
MLRPSPDVQASQGKAQEPELDKQQTVLLGYLQASEI